MNASSLLDIKVRPNGRGFYKIAISLFGKRQLSIETEVKKPERTVSDQLYALAMGFKALGDSVKEMEEKKGS